MKRLVLVLLALAAGCDLETGDDSCVPYEDDRGRYCHLDKWGLHLVCDEACVLIDGYREFCPMTPIGPCFETEEAAGPPRCFIVEGKYCRRF